MALQHDQIFEWLCGTLEEEARRADVKIKTAPMDLAAIVEREQLIGLERGLKYLASLVSETIKNTKPNE